MSRITPEQFNAMIEADLPFAHEAGVFCQSIGPGRAVLRLPFNKNMLRPGSTIAGPSMMMLADGAMYAAVLSRLGAVKLAVTTSFNINFLNKPGHADLLAEAEILKLGKRLAVIEVHVHSDGTDEPVAHATGTYSIPPETAR